MRENECERGEERERRGVGVEGWKAGGGGKVKGEGMRTGDGGGSKDWVGDGGDD